MKTATAYPQFTLRLSLGASFIVADMDRFGMIGQPGDYGVSWGNWKQFSLYAHKLMYFFPYGLAEILSIIATIAELVFGLFLVLGWFTRWSAIGSGLILMAFAISMAVSLGIRAPVSYSVFTVAGGAFLLATISEYRWSLDNLLNQNKTNSPVLLSANK